LLDRFSMALRSVILYGSVRTERRGIGAARFVEAQLRGRGHDTSLVDPAELQLPLLDRRYAEYRPGTAPEVLRRLAELFKPADAFVIVSGEYNHGVPPALKNLLDHFFREFFFRPSGIVSYSSGAYAGVRAAAQLRSILAELGMSSIRTVFTVPRVHEAFDAEGNALDPSLERKFDRFATELEWYASALAEARQLGVPY
jgi:NAD(P)H-dependent FMN reductase